MNFDDHNPDPQEKPIVSDVSPEYVSAPLPRDPNASPTRNPAGTHSEFAPVVTPGYLGPVVRSLPEDLRVPWGWSDLLVLLVVAFALLVILTTVVVAGFRATGVSMTQIKQSITEQGLVSIIAMTLLSVSLLVYLAAQIRLRFRSPVWRTLGWRPLHTGQVPRRTAYLGLIASGFLLSFLVAGASSLFKTKTNMPIEQFFQDRHTAVLLLIMSVTLAPLLEETVFRGYIYPVAARSFGVPLGILFTGAIFGLLHSSQLGNNWPQVGLLVLVGIIFTYVRAKSGTVIASYILHVSYNSFIVLSVLIASRGFHHLPQFH
jgi:membrane protease YdiL (CAAX protease family)